VIDLNGNCLDGGDWRWHVLFASIWAYQKVWLLSQCQLEINVRGAISVGHSDQLTVQVSAVCIMSIWVIATSIWVIVTSNVLANSACLKLSFVDLQRHFHANVIKAKKEERQLIQHLSFDPPPSTSCHARNNICLAAALQWCVMCNSTSAHFTWVKAHTNKKNYAGSEELLPTLVKEDDKSLINPLPHACLDL
jgi:hypothetical protein